MSRRYPPSTVEFITEERALVSGGLVFLSGLTAADPGTGIAPQAKVSGEFPYYGSNIQKQTRYLLEKAARILEANGSGLEHVVKTQVFIADCTLFDAFDQIWKAFFPVPPPRTTVGVGHEKLPIPEALISVDIIAAQPAVLDIAAVDSPRLPKPLANYTPCVGAGDWLFLAGQLPTDFGDTGLAPKAQVNQHFRYHGSPITAQANYTLQICETLLEDARSDWDHTARVHIFLKDLDDAPVVERLFTGMFDGAPPPYLIIGVDELLTGGAMIEVDVIATRAAGAQSLSRSVTETQAGTVALSGNGSTAFALAHVSPASGGADRMLAVEQAVREAVDAATGLAGGDARPVKVHAFLPMREDVFPFGCALPETLAQGAAITTSPAPSPSNGLSIEVVYSSGA
jgi:enamine deaminase RidA (YjgF/YER057c/UK114 family)